MAICNDEELLKKEFLDHMRKNPLDLITTLRNPAQVQFFNNEPVKSEWIHEAKMARRARQAAGYFPTPAIMHPQNTVRITNVETVATQPRQQGKTWAQSLRNLANSVTAVADKTRELAATTQAQSDTLNAISKHIQNKSEQDFKKLWLGTFETEKKMSGSYPIRVESVSLDHRGGTKSYHATKVTAQDGKSLVILRFGKTGSFGQVKVDTHDLASQAEKAFDKKIDEKMKKGYAVDPRHDPKPQDASDFEELRLLIGRATVSKLGPNHLAHIDPSLDTTGVREAEMPRYDENGHLDKETQAEKARRLEEEKRKAREELKRREEEEFKTAYADNPNFGAF